MDEEQQEDQVQAASTFFDPPAYLYRSFTTENVARMKELRRTVDPSQVRIPDLPPELTNLQPPAEPADGVTRVFGNRYTLKDELPSLEEQGIQRLGAPTGEATRDGKYVDQTIELKRLAKSLLLNYLELLGVMSINVEQAEEKMEDISTLFINLHHRLNEYRPHQARESLIALMQDKLDRTRNETAALRAVTDKARRVLEGLGSLSIAAEAAGPAVVKAKGAASLPASASISTNRELKPVWLAMDSRFL